MKLQEGGPQAYYFIKKDTPAQVEICKIFKSTFFIEQLWTTVSGYIRILTVKKFQYQSSLSKSYKEAGGRGRTKLLLPTRINYQKCTLAKRLFKLCDWEFYTVTYCTWFCTEYPYVHSLEGSLRNEGMITLCLFPNIRRGCLWKINIFCQFGTKCILQEGIFAKNCEDLWGFFLFFHLFIYLFILLQAMYKWIPLSFVSRHNSSKRIPHNVAARHHTDKYIS